MLQESKKWFNITISKSNIPPRLYSLLPYVRDKPCWFSRWIFRKHGFWTSFSFLFCSEWTWVLASIKTSFVLFSKISPTCHIKVCDCGFFWKKEANSVFFSFTHLLITIWWNFVKFEFKIAEKINEILCDTEQNPFFFKNSEMFFFLSLH